MSTFTVEPVRYGRPQHDADEPVRPSEFYGDAQHEESSAFGPVGCVETTN